MYQVRFPQYFDDDAAIIEAKGYFADLVIDVDGEELRPEIYDWVRLAQRVGDDLGAQAWFAVSSLIVVESVTRQHIEDAVDALAATGFDRLAPRQGR